MDALPAGGYHEPAIGAENFPGYPVTVTTNHLSINLIGGRAHPMIPACRVISAATPVPAYPPAVT
eukprot:3485516-Rhodomonas_salina.3